MFCKYCGATLESDSLFCSRCGKRITAEADATAPCSFPQQERNSNSAGVEAKGGVGNINPLCIAGCVLALLSFFLNDYWIIPLAGLVVSIIGLSKAKKKGQGGASLAIIGIIVSAILFAYGLIAYAAIYGIFSWLRYFFDIL